MAEPKSTPFEFPTGERIVIGLGAASGLITAACISGLPSVSCTSLAQTHTLSIICFGSTALGALLALACIFFSRPRISFVKAKSANILAPGVLINCYRATAYELCAEVGDGVKG